MSYDNLSSVSQNVLKFYQQLTGEERRIPFIFDDFHFCLSRIRPGFAPSFVNYKKGALDSQPQVIKFTSCLPMVGGSLRVLRLPPPLKLVAMI